MAVYEVQTTDGTYEVETEDPPKDHPDYIAPGKEITFSVSPDTLSKYYTPTLEGAGAVIGGAVSSALGPIATAAGGTLGFAGGKAVANLIDRGLGVQPPIDVPGAIKETGSDIYAGAKNEAVGLGAGAALSKASQAAQAALKSKPVGRFGEFLSGKTSSLYKRLANDPQAMLPSWLGGPPPLKQAGAALGQAVDEAGIAKSLNPNPDYSGTVTRAFDKVMADVPTNLKEAEQISALKENVSRLTPQETFDAYNSLKKLIKTQVANKDPELNRARVIFQNALRDRLTSLNGEYAKASKDYARSILRSDFTDLFPTTKYGMPSIGRAGFVRMALGKLSLPLSSPLIHGLLVSGGSAGMKAVQKLVSYPELTPVMGQILNSYLDSQSDFESSPSGFSLSKVISNAKGQVDLSPTQQPVQSSEVSYTKPGDSIYLQALTAYLAGDKKQAGNLAYQALQKNPNQIEAIRLLERLGQNGKSGYRVNTRVSKAKP